MIMILHAIAVPASRQTCEYVDHIGNVLLLENVWQEMTTTSPTTSVNQIILCNNKPSATNLKHGSGTACSADTPWHLGRWPLPQSFLCLHHLAFHSSTSSDSDRSLRKVNQFDFEQEQIEKHRDAYERVVCCQLGKN